jgi:hypothetical protein
VKYRIPDEVEKRITDDWDIHGYPEWCDFVVSLSPGIIGVDIITQPYWFSTITFDTEEHKNWFILKYS